MKHIFFIVFLSFFLQNQAHSGLLHKVDKKDILQTFEIQPFTFDISQIQGRDLIETRAILSELILLNAADNLQKFAKYANLPASFGRDEMTEARFKVFNMFLRKNRIEYYHDPSITKEIDQAMYETLEAFINRPHVDNYYDLKEVLNRLESVGPAAAQPGREVAVAGEETTFMGIPKATTQNIAVLALILAALSLVKSFKPNNDASKRR